MASYNRIILVGHLTRDPVLTYTPANTAVCKFGIATNRKWKDREGNKRDEVCFVDCVLFANAAETFAKFMGVGKPVLVEGRLTFNQWTSQEGQKRSKHEVAVDNFTFLGDGGGKGDGAAVKRPDERPAAAPDDSELPF